MVDCYEKISDLIKFYTFHRDKLPCNMYFDCIVKLIQQNPETDCNKILLDSIDYNFYEVFNFLMNNNNIILDTKTIDNAFYFALYKGLFNMADDLFNFIDDETIDKTRELLIKHRKVVSINYLNRKLNKCANINDEFLIDLQKIAEKRKHAFEQYIIELTVNWKTNMKDVVARNIKDSNKYYYLDYYHTQNGNFEYEDIKYPIINFGKMKLTNSEILTNIFNGFIIENNAYMLKIKIHESKFE